MDKEALWEQTKMFAGITYHDFARYFERQEQGAAYRLGQVIEYSEPKLLSEFGIFYYPQSLVYVKNAK